MADAAEIEHGHAAVESGRDLFVRAVFPVYGDAMDDGLGQSAAGNVVDQPSAIRADPNIPVLVVDYVFDGIVG